MQQVTDIYRGEGGWDSLAWHGFTTMSIHTRLKVKGSDGSPIQAAALIY